MNINVDLIYPIGSIYMTTNTISPAVLFGGTWERIKGKCIVGVDEDDTDFGTVSNTGGEKTHTLTESEMPSHNHDKGGDNQGYLLSVGGSGSKGSSYGGSPFVYAGVVTSESTSFKSKTIGGSQAHNNLQPYYTAYVWRRVS